MQAHAREWCVAGVFTVRTHTTEWLRPCESMPPVSKMHMHAAASTTPLALQALKGNEAGSGRGTGKRGGERAGKDAAVRRRWCRQSAADSCVHTSRSEAIPTTPFWAKPI